LATSGSASTRAFVDNTLAAKRFPGSLVIFMAALSYAWLVIERAITTRPVICLYGGMALTVELSWVRFGPRGRFEIGAIRLQDGSETDWLN